MPLNSVEVIQAAAGALGAGPLQRPHTECVEHLVGGVSASDHTGVERQNVAWIALDAAAFLSDSLLPL